MDEDTRDEINIADRLQLHLYEIAKVVQQRSSGLTLLELLGVKVGAPKNVENIRPSKTKNANPSPSNDAPGNPDPLVRALGEGRSRPERRTQSEMKGPRPVMSEPHDRHRFIPCPPSTIENRPFDLFHDQEDRSANGFRRYFHRQDDRTILVFTDGSCLDQGVPGKRRAGWSVVYNANDNCFYGALEGRLGGPEQTSNRAELRAVIVFLQARYWECGGADRFVVATDSEYVVEGVCGRLQSWIKRGWKTNTGTPVQNRDLWEVLKRELDSAELVGIDDLFWRIPREWNDRADELAKRGANMV
ncbi:ribonuclease H-like protein [Clavulina sp. PMI_390]|nr:ribonuclease H-like protein [Clavulina sp. PMI_390]